MNDKEILKWPNTTNNFTKHLNITNNRQIIFSGRFGIGKTTFLDDYFKNPPEELEEKYFFTHLFPVNYQISPNENIIKFLKADILVELLNDPQIENREQKSELEIIGRTLKQTFKNHGKEILKSGLSIPLEVFKTAFPGIGLIETIIPGLSVLGKSKKFLSTIIESIQKEYENEKTDKVNQRTAEIQSIIPWNHDFLLERIENLVTKQDKKSILILDDLDRLDPEHIFRILNVFSTLNEPSKKNKESKILGYNKIILVCDLKNIQRIFEHKYGSETDFGGYIDKFYSVNPFNVDADEQIITALKGENQDGILYKIFAKIKNEYPKFSTKLDRNLFIDVMFVACIYLLKVNKLNLRELMKIFIIESVQINIDNWENVFNTYPYKIMKDEVLTFYITGKLINYIKYRKKEEENIFKSYNRIVDHNKLLNETITPRTNFVGRSLIKTLEYIKELTLLSKTEKPTHNLNNNYLGDIDFTNQNIRDDVYTNGQQILGLLYEFFEIHE